MAIIHAIDKKMKTHDINISRILEEFRSKTYDGQFDDTLKKLFVWVTYPLIDVESNIGFVMANDIDQANYIISILSMQGKMEIDAFQTINVYRVYDWLITNNALMKSKEETKDKIYLWSNTDNNNVKKSGVVVAKSHIGAKHELIRHGIAVNESLTIKLFDKKKSNFEVF